ncbi:MAG TPA: hypothetical protein VHZ33_21465 [Trebonia sp.]|nr:hypothetical protein [Trebonia sp.]
MNTAPATLADADADWDGVVERLAAVERAEGVAEGVVRDAVGTVVLMGDGPVVGGVAEHAADSAVIALRAATTAAARAIGAI